MQARLVEGRDGSWTVGTNPISVLKDPYAERYPTEASRFLREPETIRAFVLARLTEIGAQHQGDRVPALLGAAKVAGLLDTGGRGRPPSWQRGVSDGVGGAGVRYAGVRLEQQEAMAASAPRHGAARSRRLRLVTAALGLLLASPISACGTGDDEHCPGIMRAFATVTLTDKATGQAVCGARAALSAGDESFVATEYPPCVYTFRDGLLDVDLTLTVTAEGYDASSTTVRVGTDPCGIPATEDVELELLAAPPPSPP